MSKTGMCRICGGVARTLLSLGDMPPANQITQTRDHTPPQFPLLLEACVCGNFQLRDCVDAAMLYTEYSYMTPRSPLLETHYERLTCYLRAGGYIHENADVLEIGSNVGAFLEHLRPLVRSVLGVDPARNIAQIACDAGVPTVAAFFNASFARDRRLTHGTVDAIVARHCMAHNFDPYAMLDGVTQLLSPNGVLVIENAYAVTTFENNEIDQIYHEHMFYFTLHAIEKMLAERNLTLCDVMLSDIHGGSVSCIAKRSDTSPVVKGELLRALERERDLLAGGLAERFAASAERTRSDLRAIITDFSRQKKSVYAYGATAKGATLLNFSGLTHKDIPYCADSTPIKQGKFVPKCGVEIVSEEWAFEHPPSAFLLTAWNYRDELIAKVRAAGLLDVQFIVPIPHVTVV
jgi:SAM-dependent methyltransferase